MDVKRYKTKEGRPATFQAPTPTKKPTLEEPQASPKKPHLLGHPRKKTLAIFALVVIVCSVLIGWFVASRNSAPEVSSEPGYKSILPEGKSIASLGGWQRVSPPENDPVYAYSDTIDDTAISISEQPLPKSFKGNVTKQVTELAKSYNATKKLQADDTVFYVGTSSKGPQSVIFTKENLLVFIKSEKTVADASWSAYIVSLSSNNLDNIPKY